MSKNKMNENDLDSLLFSFFLKKENEQKTNGVSELNEPEIDAVATKLGITGSSAKATNGLINENTPHTSKLRPVSSTQDICKSVRADIQPAVPSSAKRRFSDLERSPEQLGIQAKKRNTDYKRCYEVPEETMKFHTGLTGTFSTIQIGHFVASTEGIGLSEDRVPTRSSPIAVAKTLFCDLEEPTEEVFEDGAKNLSFASSLSANSDICRSLSLDSDGSMHETSLTVASHSSLKPGKHSRSRDSAAPEGREEKKHSFITDPLSQTPSVVATPVFAHGGLRGESLACGVAQSPSFLKPRNVVAFRSYCSSINRSNVSGVSRLSIGSVETMDLSTSGSYYSAHGTATPVQKRPRSTSSLMQVGRDALKDQCTPVFRLDIYSC